MKRSVLILSSTPPIPRDYGNRNRVFETYSFFKSLEFDTSFLLYPFDADWTKDIPPYYNELKMMFDYFSVIPNSHELHRQAAGFHHEIDEWWDPNIGKELEWLFLRKRFDVFFVNYTFFSKAFDYTPQGTLKVLETHDIFTGRREAFEKHGVSPEFFYTSQEREKIAFDRADIVIGIKDVETKLIASMTNAETVSVPYWDFTVSAEKSPRRRSGLQFDHKRPLRVGFIGADNSVNAVNMERFIRRMDKFMTLFNAPITLRVAGNVCRRLSPVAPWVELLGRVGNGEGIL